MLVERGEAQRGLLFLGDDDLTSAAVVQLLKAMEVDRPIRAVDVDEALVAHLQAHGVDATHHDLRDPLRTKPAGCVFTDPPYAPEGFGLFASRAADCLKPDGRVWICFGTSRRAKERGLKKQRLLAELGVYVLEVIPDFNAYEGGESLGARSNLWIAERTPQTKPLVTGRDERDLYTRR